MQDENILPVLIRIADALDRLAPPALSKPDWDAADAFLWQAAGGFEPVADLKALPLEVLHGIDHQKRKLLVNTTRFAEGFPANHALLWGARGTGKSSLVKALHAHLVKAHPFLRLIEISREDIASLPNVLAALKNSDRRFVLLCDDLSFDQNDDGYKSLKSVLDGGIAGKPDNVLFYATSNRRHLMPREMMENESATAIHPGETIDEKVSLSDRFGLWIGFHSLDQAAYLNIIGGYLRHFAIDAPAGWQAQALEWQKTRGARSGRVAWQYFVNLLSETGQRLSFSG